MTVRAHEARNAIYRTYRPGLEGRRTGSFSGRGRAGAGQQGRHLAGGAFAPGWFWQREVRLGVVAVAAAVLLLGQVAGPGPGR
jgi:hypothetical protein